MNKLMIKVLLSLCLVYFDIGTLYAHGDHSIPCSGPHKNDPGCNVAPPPPISVFSAKVDWINEKIIVTGVNFSADTTVSIAGNTTSIESWTPTQLDIAMDSAIAGSAKGNHNAIIEDQPSSSSGSISLYTKASLIDKNLAGCPCETEWQGTLQPLGLWTQTAECTEINGGSGNPVDIASTIYSDPADQTAFPQYPIGAAFTSEPSESVCQLTIVDNTSPTPVTDLVKIRINRQQQGACRTVLANNICNSINTVSP